MQLKEAGFFDVWTEQWLRKCLTLHIFFIVTSILEAGKARDVVLGLGPLSFVVLKDKTGVLGPGLGLEPSVLGPGLGLEAW